MGLTFPRQDLCPPCALRGDSGPGEPRVSVVMPVYNGERFLAQAVESMLLQSFTDFEFIVVDDGSTDNSRALLDSYSDSRLKVFGQERTGLARALNRGIQLARGDYIALMGADDVSMVPRLLRQVEVLDANDALALTATRSLLIDAKGGAMGTREMESHSPYRLWKLQFFCVYVHGSVMVRKNIFETHEGYDPRYSPAEDYDLWARISDAGNTHLIPEVLHCSRIAPGRNGASLHAHEPSSQGERISKRNLRTCYPHLSDSAFGALKTLYCPPETTPGTAKEWRFLRPVFEGFCNRYGLEGPQRYELLGKVIHDLGDVLRRLTHESRYERIRIVGTFWKSSPYAVTKEFVFLMFSPISRSEGDSSMTSRLEHSSGMLARVPVIGPAIGWVVEGVRNPYSDARKKLRDLYRVPILGYLIESLAVLLRLPRLIERLNRLEDRINPDLADGDRLKLLEKELPALLNHMTSLSGLVRQHQRTGKRLESVEDRIESLRDEFLRVVDYSSRAPQTTLEPDVPLSQRDSAIRVSRAVPHGVLTIKIQCGDSAPIESITVGTRESPGVDIVADPTHLPIGEGRATEIQSSDLLQLFSDEDLLERVLPYWLGLLKPGGRLSAVVPDWETALQQYQSGDLPFESLKRNVFGTGSRDGGRARTGFTRESMEEILVATGFRDISFPYWGLLKNGIIQMHVIAYK